MNECGISIRKSARESFFLNQYIIINDDHKMLLWDFEISGPFQKKKEFPSSFMFRNIKKKTHYLAKTPLRSESVIDTTSETGGVSSNILSELNIFLAELKPKTEPR